MEVDSYLYFIFLFYLYDVIMMSLFLAAKLRQNNGKYHIATQKNLLFGDLCLKI